jgi:hypothetical protein
MQAIKELFYAVSHIGEFPVRKITKYLCYSLWYRHQFPLRKALALGWMLNLGKKPIREQQSILTSGGMTTEEAEDMTGAIRDVQVITRGI